jgi:hypothetical protein
VRGRTSSPDPARRARETALPRNEDAREEHETTNEDFEKQQNNETSA